MIPRTSICIRCYHTKFVTEFYPTKREGRLCSRVCRACYAVLNAPPKRILDRPALPDGTSYEDYLQSNHWRNFRKKALEYAEYRCQLCYADAPLHVHHRTYERLGNERLADVICLCSDCHSRFHGVALT